MKKVIASLFLLVPGLLIAQNSCNNAFQYCGNTVTLPLDTTGIDMGSVNCMATTPNPTWFFFEVTQNGNINTQITGYQQDLTSGLDIDVFVSGPYASMDCVQIMDSVTNGNNIAYCNYSTSGVNSYTLLNVLAGEFYVIVVTNFSDQAGYAEFFDTGSTATFEQSNCVQEVNENKNTSIHFANPVFDYLEISGLPEEEYVFSVYDLSGKTVYSGSHHSEYLKINTSELNSGYYITEIIASGHKRMTGKFIKANK